VLQMGLATPRTELHHWLMQLRWCGCISLFCGCTSQVSCCHCGHGAHAPLVPAQVLEDSGASKDALSSVEVVGGSSRVPAVTRAIAEFFGKEPSRTLNAKECVSRGAALQCAMLSPIFR